MALPAGVGGVCGGAAMADRPKLAGVSLPGATELSFEIRLHRVIEEGEASSPWVKMWPGKEVTAVADGGAMAGPDGAHGKVTRRR